MLGTLAKWLRLFGFDTFYATTELTDDELLHIAKEENRVIITRDKQLTQRGAKRNLTIMKITSTDIDEQLSQVLRDVAINEHTVLSRCSLCNTILKEIQKREVQERVPARIFEQHDHFWFCPTCDKIYWAGSHYDKMRMKMNKIKAMQN